MKRHLSRLLLHSSSPFFFSIFASDIPIFIVAGVGFLVGFLLVVMFSNNGNYGLPVVLFAFGQEALSYAAVYFVVSGVLVYTLGGFLAAIGRRSLRRAIAGVFKVPAIYGVLGAGVVVSLHLFEASMPAAVITTILALEFDVAPSFVTSVVFASTILSPLTPTALIAYLQRT